MTQRPVAEVRPLPPGGWWLLLAAGIAKPDIYLYSDQRWWLRDESVYPDPLEYWIIEREDGSLELAENAY